MASSMRSVFHYVLDGTKRGRGSVMYESINALCKDGAPLRWPCLLGDIGGTHARFGWQEGPHQGIEDVAVLPCEGSQGVLDVVLAYLKRAGKGSEWFPSAAFGIATAVVGDQVHMCNRDWSFSVNELRAALGLERLLVLNDFTALALSIPALPDSCRRKIGSGEPVADAPIALLGPGTGLGVSGLMPAKIGKELRWSAISGEGGHVTLGACTEDEFGVLQTLQGQYGHVSAERVLSGPGLVALYQTLSSMGGLSNQAAVQPAQVLDLALNQADVSANKALDMFCGFLGSVAGNLALTLGARGGVYIGGGIVPRLGRRFDASPFRERFESKGRFTSYLQAIPVWVIDSPVSPALQGAAQALLLSA